MKNKKKVFLLISLCLIILTVIVFSSFSNSKKEELKVKRKVNIEEVLRTEAYSYLPEEAKQYIREVYKNTGQVLLTEKNKKGSQTYLSPDYVNYLTGNQDNTIIPNPTRYDYTPVGSPSSSNLPEVFDLRNVDGKNFVTPFKNQGGEGLCWDYAATAHLESHLLFKANKSYDESSEIFSEKQMDYATAKNGSKIQNGIYNLFRSLTTAGNSEIYQEILMDGLGAVYKSWDNNHTQFIVSNSILDRSEIYNFANSNYELNSSVTTPYYNFNNGTEDEKEEYINYLKNLVMESGGGYVSVINSQIVSYNYYGPSENENDDTYNNWFPVMHLEENSRMEMGDEGHAMEVIGWDDTIEYKTCANYRRRKIYSTTTSCDNGDTLHEGKGVWILKNSWGADSVDKIVYLAYDSFGTSMWFIKELGKKNWDNYYKLQSSEMHYDYDYNYEDNYYFQDEYDQINEKLNKIKINLSVGNYTIQISNDGGNTFNTLDSFQIQSEGINTFDYSNRNIIVTNNTVFKLISTDNPISYVGNFNIYTNNIDNTPKINTESIEYDINNDVLGNNNTRSFLVKTKTKNIPDKTNLSIKLKDMTGSYINDSYYEVNYSKTYANTNIAELLIESDKFPKGIYKIEVCSNTTNCIETTFNIKLDFLYTEGNGTVEDPWQITNARQFNLIRNYPDNNFVLKNDIDFEYDTQDPNGALYNDGNGFIPIDSFFGCIDGNNHKLKNIYIKNESASIFQNISVYSKCGIKNIQLYNPTIIGEYAASGLANIVTVSSPLTDGLSNISSIGGNIKIENSGYQSNEVAGLFLNIYYFGNYNYLISNVYNSTTISTEEVPNNKVYALIGNINNYSGQNSTLRIENAINIGKINCNNCTNQSMIGINDNQNTYSFNNIISINNNTLPIVKKEDNSSNNLNFSNIYSTSSTLINNIATAESMNNVLLNKNTYEIANADYSEWENFDDNWTKHNIDNINRIPILKNIDYDYFEFDNEAIHLEVGESKDLSSLVLNDKYKDSLVITDTCSFAIPICNNETDTSIVSLNGTVVTALKNGSTKVLVMNEHDGYLGTLDIRVNDINIVKFNPNGGTGTMETQEYHEGVEAKLSKNTFTYGKHTFDHWNTKPDDSGTSYYDEESISINKDLNLYAIWNYKKYTITYNANGGTGSMEPQVFIDGETKQLSKNNYEKEAYEFDHWNTASDDSGTTYTKEQEITPTEDVTLYAIYRLVSYNKITFNSNGGEYVAPLYVESGKIPTMPLSKKKGYYFFGWYTDPEFNNYVYNKSFDSDTELYALWSNMVITWNLNGAETNDKFEPYKSVEINSLLDLVSPEEFGIIPPSGKELDAYIIYGTRYDIGQKVFVREEMEGGEIHIECLWKEPSEKIEEKYKLSFSNDRQNEHQLRYNQEVSEIIEEKREDFDAFINSFKDGKKEVKVQNYDDLFGTDYYSEIVWFDLLSADYEDDGILYNYKVRYKKVNVVQNNNVERKYSLVKKEDSNEEVSDSIDIEEYINNKKNAFIEQYNKINIDNLFVIDKTNNKYQYATFINTEPIDSIYNSDKDKYILNYNTNYNLVDVSIIGKQEYTLSDNESSISFIEDEKEQFTFTIENLKESTDTNIQDKISKQKNNLSKNQELLAYYKIEVKKGEESLHDGPFKLKIKVTPEMKKYKRYYMIFVNDNKNEEPIEFTRNNEYLEGTLNHLSEYILVGDLDAEPVNEEIVTEEHQEEQKEEKDKKIKNPLTIDKIPFYLVITMIIISSIIYIRKKMEHKRYKMN